ncbi:MAG: ABC transporter ATP-binding protein/permease [Aquificaceae bacterium]|nr:ABC transporter ATP-binding protein/permease [Aquificaceae bacterium]MCX8164776.1 ABC transporter ATP-binding protein/permease [Aquificaceae bacterium]
MRHIKWVLLRLKSYWHFILLSLLGSVLEASGTAGISLLIKSLVDKVFLLKEEEELLRIVITLLGFVLLAQFGKFLGAFFSNLYTELEMKRTRGEAFEKLLKADYSAFLGTPPGDFASRVISDMSLYRNLIGSYSIKLLKEPVVVIFLFGVLIYRDWLLTLSLFLLLPLLVFAVKYFGKKRGKYIKRAQESYAEVTERLFSSFSGFESIRSFMVQSMFEKVFKDLNRALFKSSLRSEVYFSLNSVFNFTFGYLVVALVILYGGYRIAEGGLTAGDFLSYLTALLFLQNPLMETQKGFMELRSNLPVVERVMGITSLKEEKDGTKSLDTFRKYIRVESLRVLVNGHELLKGVSLELSKGEKLGIMGSTGSGKSTLLRALVGLVSYEGNISIDDLELSEIRREDLRRCFLFLSQEPFIFPGTVRENLLAVEGKEEDLWRALKLAGCDFVTDLDQPINPKSLSGGEKQRLAIARVFLKSPDLLLLDEATSALDAKREQEVLNNLFSNFQDKTFVLVAHRFTNLLRCDRVIVMKDGYVVYEGKPKDAIEFFLQSP